MTTTEHQQPTDPTTKVRRDLAEIIDLSHQVLTQAVHDANAMVDGTSLPGGRAMIALAGVGDVETFERRVELAEAEWVTHASQEGVVRYAAGTTVVLDDTDRPDPAGLEDDDAAPALQIIRYWSERYRWDLGMVWDHIPTIRTEAAFLRNPDVLAHVAAHRADEWPHMARDVNRARTHLESILHAGTRPDRTRVICNNPTCETPKQLIKVHGPTYVIAWACVSCALQIPETRACVDCHRSAPPSPKDRCTRPVGKKDERHDCDGELVSTVTLDHCPNTRCFTSAPPKEILASDEDTDRWKCTSCKKRYTDKEFDDAYKAMLRREGSERFVTVRDAVHTLAGLGVREGTVRSWLLPPRRHVSDRCRVCKRDWPPGEHNVCAGAVKGSLEPCGGFLRPIRRGNPNKVIEAYCDLATHQTLVWWPDMWKRYLAFTDGADRRRAKAATRDASESA